MTASKHQSSWTRVCILGLLCTAIYGRQWMIESIIQDAQRIASELAEAEARAWDQDIEVDEASSQVFNFLTSTKFMKSVGNLAREQRLVLQLLRNVTGLEGEKLFDFLNEEYGCSVLPRNEDYLDSDSDLPEPSTAQCPFPHIECNESNPYRSLDGSCNNLNFPHYGQAQRALARLLPPDYADQINAPRKAKSKLDLPSARAVSLSIFEDQVKRNARFTVMHMTMGQLLDHDTDRTAISQLKKDDMLEDYKCGTSGCETDGVENEACFPISVSPDDPDFSHKQCLMFVRSQEYMTDSCKVGPRQQPNAVTSWLDASFVYGSSRELMTRLRNWTDPARGQLRCTDNSPHKPLLPQQENKPCKDLDDKIKCFLTGDSRQNEQVALIALHTVFMRLHNHYEENLHRVNPHWDGEKLFQESRRLLIAVWQNIVYNEYLHVVLGPAKMRTMKLNLQPKASYYKDYDLNKDGSVFNAFSAAAFRFGHSQIGKDIKFTNPDFTDQILIPFSSVLFRPRTIYESPISGTEGITAVVLGTVSQTVEKSDRFFSKEMSAKLFAPNPTATNSTGKGMDLPALNIQRGRDHGIPGYTAWRKWCDLEVPTQFYQLNMPAEVINKFKDLYESVDDIDLYPAAMSEPNVHQGLVGETFACLIGHQFQVLRQADRFWFETDQPELRFSREQLMNIREVTLSCIFCETLDDIDKIQKYSMVASKEDTNLPKNGWITNIPTFKGSQNKRVPCNEHPSIQFDLWKESNNGGFN